MDSDHRPAGHPLHDNSKMKQGDESGEEMM